ARAPGFANFLTQTPGLSAFTKRLGGIAPERRIPAFARQTFLDWFRARTPRHVGRPSVILWPDTFNNHFHPETAAAAVEVLEALGYEVTVPSRSLCCGRPLYDFGMLRLAKRLLGEVLETLRPAIAAGVPLVALEPSCAAVFRDELVNLFPADEDAKRLSRQTFVLSEFLEANARHLQLPKLRRKAPVHGHCHEKAPMGLAAERALMSRLGLDAEVLDSGCCGMAGPLRFQAACHRKS